MGFPKMKKLLPIFFVGLLLLTGLFFFSRPPVLIVTDSSFNIIYGQFRMRLRQAELLFRLRRRVLAVMVSDQAGPEQIAIALRQKSVQPYAVLFPYRYAAGAKRYFEENPLVPMLVLQGRVVPPVQAADEPGPRVIRTDTNLDYYRAGRLSTALMDGPEGGILLYHELGLSQADRDAFMEGLKAGGFTRNPIFLNVNSDYAAWQNIACTVISGEASRFFEKNLKLPVILFSWVDPRMTPGGVKALFDDSPWALAEQAVKLLESGGEGEALASEIIFPGGHIENKALEKSLRALSKESLIGKNGEDL
ncbi:MAG: hypothetical protein LBF78_04250 [Treponema sp.]|jgi:hypothetical protein|nr:hypothetical protein [Treponema sp.]